MSCRLMAWGGALLPNLVVLAFPHSNPEHSDSFFMFASLRWRPPRRPRRRAPDRVTDNAFRHLLWNLTSTYMLSDGLGLAPARSLGWSEILPRSCLSHPQSYDRCDMSKWDMQPVPLQFVRCQSYPRWLCRHCSDMYK